LVFILDLCTECNLSGLIVKSKEKFVYNKNFSELKHLIN